MVAMAYIPVDKRAKRRCSVRRWVTWPGAWICNAAAAVLLVLAVASPVLVWDVLFLPFGGAHFNDVILGAVGPALYVGLNVFLAAMLAWIGFRHPNESVAMSFDEQLALSGGYLVLRSRWFSQAGLLRGQRYAYAAWLPGCTVEVDARRASLHIAGEVRQAHAYGKGDPGWDAWENMEPVKTYWLLGDYFGEGFVSALAVAGAQVRYK